MKKPFTKKAIKAQRQLAMAGLSIIKKNLGLSLPHDLIKDYIKMLESL